MQISLRVMNKDHKMVMCQQYYDEDEAHAAFLSISSKLKGKSSYPALVFDFVDEKLDLS